MTHNNKQFYWSIQSVRLPRKEANEFCATRRREHFLPAIRFRVLCELGEDGKVHWRSVMKVYRDEIKKFKFRNLGTRMIMYHNHTEYVNDWLKHQKKWRKR